MESWTTAPPYESFYISPRNPYYTPPKKRWIVEKQNLNHKLRGVISCIQFFSPTCGGGSTFINIVIAISPNPHQLCGSVPTRMGTKNVTSWYIFFGGLEHEWIMTFQYFPYIGNVIIPTDELIFFRGLQTTNQYTLVATSSDGTAPSSW